MNTLENHKRFHLRPISSERKKLNVISILFTKNYLEAKLQNIIAINPYSGNNKTFTITKKSDNFKFLLFIKCFKICFLSLEQKIGLVCAFIMDKEKFILKYKHVSVYISNLYYF